MSKVISARIKDSDAERLHTQALRGGRKPGELAARLLHESLIADDYPGIVFVDGPAGRRAHLAGTGLDVWEVAMLLEDGVKLEDIASQYKIRLALLHVAHRYAEDHRDEVSLFMPPVGNSR